MKNKKEKLEYRMYGLVPYQLSGIQKGIRMQNSLSKLRQEFIGWVHLSKVEINC